VRQQLVQGRILDSTVGETRTRDLSITGSLFYHYAVDWCSVMSGIVGVTGTSKDKDGKRKRKDKDKVAEAEPSKKKKTNAG